MADRGRRDPQVHLLRAGVLQHADDLAGGVAAHDRVVHDHDALARDDLRQRVELHSQAVLAQLLPRLDEGSGHVAVLDQPVVLGNARGPSEAVGRRVARVRHRDHQVGVDRRLAPQDLAHPPAHLLQDAPLEARVGPREVDVLEDAVGGPVRGHHLPRLDSVLGQRDQLAWQHLAQQLAADDVEGAALRGDARSGRRACRARAGAPRAGRGRRPPRASSSRRSSRRPRSRGITAATAFSIGRGLVHREQGGDDLRVGRAAERQARARAARCGARRRWSGCRCGRGPTLARRPATPAACSPTSRRRSSSSERGRSPCRPRARCSFCSSKTCETSPVSRSVVMWPPSQVAIPADSCPRCWSA